MKNLFLNALLFIGIIQLTQAQSLGIGIDFPTAKVHAVQPAGDEGILVDHSGVSGNAIRLVSISAANGSSTLWVQNSTFGASINAQLLTATSTSSNILATNLGTGIGIDISQSNTGATGAGISINQDGTGVFSRGINIDMDAASVAEGLAIFHNGDGAGVYTDITSAASTGIGSIIQQRGTGIGSYINMSLAASVETGIRLDHAGVGRGVQVLLSNATSTEIGISSFHSGTGIANYSQSLGDAIVSFSTGVDGTAGTFINNNASADRDALGIFAVYSGTGLGTGGGGNAAEFQHNGTNGNAVDIFLGDPALPPGPANTTSEFTALTAISLATGTSAVGSSKTAFSATNYSADPTIIIENGGTDDGDAAVIITTPSTSAFTTGLFSQSDDGAGRGIALWGSGGNYGVIGDDNGSVSGYGIFSNSDFAAVGAKAFLIDYPLDPANKTLRHFCIESDEILNMYRGIIALDANGQATVQLPEYFDVVNINPSYQLTAIGTPAQPYVMSEIKHNQFVVAGTPNTKVSWTVHAERNDPAIQYFNEQGADYGSPVREKEAYEKGKYFTPEAYGQAAEKSIFYDLRKEKIYQERKMRAASQNAYSIDQKMEALPTIIPLDPTQTERKLEVRPTNYVEKIALN